MSFPLLTIKIPDRWDKNKSVTAEFPGLTAFYNRQGGSPVSRICSVIFGDFSGYVRRFGGPGGDLADAIALYVAMEAFEDPKLFGDPVRLMRWSTLELNAMIQFKYWRTTREKGQLLGLEEELAVLKPYRIKQK